MSMPADFVDILEADAPVVALIGDRIFPMIVAKQAWDGTDRRPCLAYQTSTDEPGMTFCTTDTLRHERISLQAQAETYDAARSLADAVEAAVIDYSAVSGDSDIDRVTLDGVSEGFDPEPGLFLRDLQLSVWYRST